MSRVRTCWGIYREPAHSPGRIDDDRAILERVGEALVARGFDVKLVYSDAEFDTDSANIFAMCERGPILDRLRGAEKTGSVVVNSPDAIRNTYRHCMVELLARHGVPAPASHIVATSKDGWLKALQGFARRGIPFVVAQEHVPGDLVKFYGVRDAMAPVDSNWFEWLYHSDKGMLGHPFEVLTLRRAAFGAAAALGLEIFGGDAIVQADGKPVIVDINAWPSYARYRDSGAQAIADHLTERFQRRPRIVARAGV
jgi:hypothetical protein